MKDQILCGTLASEPEYPSVQKLSRVPSGIEGLDRILGGGFVEGASFIIQGPPGAGKTILSNQISFAHAAAGGKVVYVTVLAEIHERLFQALATLSFYDAERVGQEIVYLSVSRVLKDEGLGAIVRLVRDEIKRHNASLLVFDGLLNTRYRTDVNLDVKTFVAEIQSQAAFVGCTVLFLTSKRLEDSSPEHTMVDGVIELNNELSGVRSVRQLQVHKSRGSASLGGLHEFEISADGVTVYPRLEGALTKPSEWDGPDDRRLTTGCDSMDLLIKGGLPRASVTLLTGPGGSGKTTFGLHFLSMGSPAEPSLFFGFSETPARLHMKASALGITLPPKPYFDIIRNPLAENLLDKLGYQLLERVRANNIRRLFIDGLGGFERAAVHHERLIDFLSTLATELRELGTTTIMTWELNQVPTTAVTGPTGQVSAIIDNVILLRQIEREYDLERTIVVQKMRDSDFVTTTHKLEVTDKGLKIGDRVLSRTGGDTATANLGRS